METPQNAAVPARDSGKGDILEGRLNVMRLAKNILLCLLLTCASGCRVVPIPLTHAIPSPVWKITVAHEATGESITNAEVLVYAEKVTSDVEFIPLNSSSEFCTPPKDSISLDVISNGGGVFIPKRRVLFYYAYPLIILPPIPPFCSFDTHLVTISAKAQGFQPVTVCYGPGRRIELDLKQQQLPDVPTPKFDRKKGEITIFLHETNAPPLLHSETNQSSP